MPCYPDKSEGPDTRRHLTLDAIAARIAAKLRKYQIFEIFTKTVRLPIEYLLN